VTSATSYSGTTYTSSSSYYGTSYYYGSSSGGSSTDSSDVATVVGAVVGVLVPLGIIAASIAIYISYSRRRRMNKTVVMTTIQTQPQANIPVIQPTIPQTNYYYAQPGQTPGQPVNPYPW
jgi:hypothetical protein